MARKEYQFDGLAPYAQQRAVNDYHKALIADGYDPYEEDEMWGLEEDLRRFGIWYYENGERAD